MISLTEMRAPLGLDRQRLNSKGMPLSPMAVWTMNLRPCSLVAFQTEYTSVR